MQFYPNVNITLSFSPTIVNQKAIGPMVIINVIWAKVKVGVLRPVQQPGSYWDRSSELPLVGLEPTEVTAYD